MPKQPKPHSTRVRTIDAADADTKLMMGQGVIIDDETCDRLLKIGAGNLSDGIRIAAQAYPMEPS